MNNGIRKLKSLDEMKFPHILRMMRDAVNKVCTHLFQLDLGKIYGDFSTKGSFAIVRLILFSLYACLCKRNVRLPIFDHSQI